MGETMNEFYIQRHQSGCVGNSMVWWEQGDNGYTCDIQKARVWSDEDSARLVLMSSEKYARWPKASIDGILQHHVDIQDARNIKD